MIALAGPRLGAQEANVSMKIDMVAWGDDITGLSLKPGQTKGKVTALAFRYSTPLSYSGPAVMEIYRSGDGDAKSVPEPTAEDIEHELHPLVADDRETVEGKATKPKHRLARELEKRRKKTPTLVALAALPEYGCRRATVLLAPDDGGTYTAYVIDDDPSKLPLGQLRVHNLSPLGIALRCNGGANQVLKTRESFIAPIQNQTLIYELAYKLGDEWRTQENNIIPVRETEQTQMIVLKSNNRFFMSTDGSSGGFLQVVTLRRGPSPQ
jgi:hypothetical protein